MEGRHAGPVLRLGDAYMGKRITDPRHFILVGPVPLERGFHSGFHFAFVCKQLIEVGFVFSCIRCAEEKVHTGAVIVGNAGDKVAADAEEAGHRIGGTGLDAAERAAVEMLLLDDGQGIGPVLQTQVRAGSCKPLLPVRSFSYSRA